MTIHDLEVNRLRIENKQLRERVEDLEYDLKELHGQVNGAKLFFPIEWALTARETDVLRYLVVNTVGEKKAIHRAMYPREWDAPDLKIMDVFICKLRRKVRPFGVEIDTVWGIGWSLNSGLREKLRVAA